MSFQKDSQLENSLDKDSPRLREINDKEQPKVAEPVCVGGQ